MLQPQALRASQLAASTSERRLSLKDNEDYYIYKLEAKELKQQLEAAKNDVRNVREQMKKEKDNIEEEMAKL